MNDRKTLVERAENAARESRYIDFKSKFDLTSGGDWCEVIKDIVAMANSGGGIIVFGVADDGSNCEFDGTALLAFDTADIANRMARYTGNQTVDVEVVEIKRGEQSRPAIVVSNTDVPMIFSKPGTYDIGGGRQKTAFAQGTLYFRHGSKSEPGNRDDLASWRDREISKVRKNWLGGIRKVVEAAPGDTVTVVSSSRLKGADSHVINAKVSSDPSAVSFVPRNAAELWPHRQKDLILEVNGRLGTAARINSHDVYCIKTVFDVLKSHPEFSYQSHPLASPQYSNAFADWIVSEYRKDNAFFHRVRTECRSKTK